MMTSKQIINDVKESFKELNYSILYQDTIPVQLVGLYDNSPIFVIQFSDGTINFETLYKNGSYKKFIKPTINEQEKFLVESEGVSFYYVMHRSLIQKLIPKVILAFKNYYISNKKELIENDFLCRR